MAVADSPEPEHPVKSPESEIESPEKHQEGSRLRWILLAVVLIAAAVLVYAGGADKTKITAVPAIGGPFTLTNQHGKQVTETDFRGKYMLIFFGYTYCPDVCPTTMTDVSSALDGLGELAERITPVFVTIDPVRDTPEHLKEYATYFHPRLVALSGTPEQTAAIAKAYRVYYAKADQPDAGPDDYLMDHSSVIYLIGPDGQFRQHFSHGTDAETLARRIRESLS